MSCEIKEKCLPKSRKLTGKRDKNVSDDWRSPVVRDLEKIALDERKLRIRRLDMQCDNKGSNLNT